MPNYKIKYTVEKEAILHKWGNKKLAKEKVKKEEGITYEQDLLFPSRNDEYHPKKITIHSIDEVK